MKKILAISFLVIAFLAKVSAQDTLYVKPATSSEAWTSQSTVYTSLQSALDDAVSGDQIWVAAGTYVPSSRFPNGTDDRCKSFILKSGVSVYGGFVGTETSLEEREIDDEAWAFSHATILSGDISNTPGNDADNVYHIVYGKAVSNLVLDGFTISGGYANRTAYNDEQKGAGIYFANASQCVVSNCQLINNTAQLQGGAAYMANTCSLESCLIQNNQSTAANSTGGAVYFDNFSYAGVAASECVFLQNTCAATANVSASSRYGGGAVSAGNNCIFEYCSFVQNSCTNPGGAIYCSSGNSFNFCFFSMNSASKGGAIFGNTSSSLLTSNCLFTNNLASNQAGAIYTSGSSCRSVNCTFVGNSAPTYTVINGGTGFTVFNSILWNNGADASNLMPGNVNCMYTAAEGVQLSGTDNLSASTDDIAFFAPCYIVGIPDNEEDIDSILHADYAIYGSSVCKDAGSVATLSLSGYQFPDEDLSGDARINGNAIDLGCFEVQCPEDSLVCAYQILDTLYNDTLPGTGTIDFQFVIENYDPNYTYTLRIGNEEQCYESTEGYMLQFDFPGTITITIVRFDEESGCSDEVDVVIDYQDSIFNPHSGIVENMMSQLEVFPNPTTDFCTIHHSLNLMQNAQIEIFDVNGKMIATQSVDNDDITINLSNYKSGIYIVRMVSNNEIIAISRIVKK